MNVEYQILALLFLHWVADFLLQSHQMASNKSSSIYWLTVHVATYSSVWFLAGIFLFPILTVITFTAITFACHWTTDYFTSKWTGRLWREQKIHNFFVVIGLDQFLHFTQLILTYTLLTS